jgi:hypothetical protein
VEPKKGKITDYLMAILEPMLFLVPPGETVLSLENFLILNYAAIRPGLFFSFKNRL